MAEVGKWIGFGYQQVPGLANRLISRYLRTQRKNMRRFFTERGLFDLAERMSQIRRSRQGMLAKNHEFQKVLNEYSKRATTTTKPATETAPTMARQEDGIVDLRIDSGAVRRGIHDDVGVSEVASVDGDSELVIEE